VRHDPDVSSIPTAAGLPSPRPRPALHDLVEEIRSTMLAVALSDADDALLTRARDTLRELRGELAGEQRTRLFRPGFDRFAAIAGQGPDVPVRTGSYNPFGIPVEMRFTPDTASATLTANALHEGPREGVHGGVIGYLMDVILGVLVQSQGRPAVTATLDIRYLRLTPLDVPLELSSRIVRRDGRKTWVEGCIEHDGTRTAEAEGLFIDLAR
jgi:acyl-coenzyme A thioesterase PaaI-like protein